MLLCVGRLWQGVAAAAAVLLWSGSMQQYWAVALQYCAYWHVHAVAFCMQAHSKGIHANLADVALATSCVLRTAAATIVSGCV
ncbi:hypothetical protein COO60DRAFT_1120583 [Scenedesmus sp. NREL 46B-D3]|nr:hypothetical protein COO60DRAFT_1120583 [Scenedesmus sp. NREL 46B-D3]